MQVIVCGRVGDDPDNDDDCLSVFFMFYITIMHYLF